MSIPKFMQGCWCGLLCLSLGVGPAAAIDLIPDWFDGDDAEEVEGDFIWKAGKQYIKFVPRESSAPANEHPIALKVGDVAAALSALQYDRDPGLLSREEGVSLFVASEVSDLSNGIVRGLAAASPDQDLAFVLVGLHSSTFAKERMAIGGRVFYVGGKLNIVLGDVHKPLKVAPNKAATTTGEVSTDIDLRLEPIQIGEREDARSLKERVTGPKGLEFVANERGTPREDWLVLDLNALVAAQERARSGLTEGMEAERRKMQAEAQKLAIERRQMREEMARMRKEIKSGGGEATAESLEERLKKLDALKEKGLISEKEYTAKRDAILSEI